MSNPEEMFPRKPNKQFAALFMLLGCFFFLFSCSKDLESVSGSSPFDQKPQFSITTSESNSANDSLVISINPINAPIELESSMRLSLSDYHFKARTTSYQSREKIVLPPLSKTLPGQNWVLQIFTRFSGSNLVVDTVLNINGTGEEGLQLSPSWLQLFPGDSAYTDLVFFGVEEELLAGSVELTFPAQSITIDTVVFLTKDRNYYFKSILGNLFTNVNKDVSGKLLLDFGIFQGLKEGTDGSGRLARIYFHVLEPGFHTLGVNKIELRDKDNAPIDIEPLGARVEVSG